MLKPKLSKAFYLWNSLFLISITPDSHHHDCLRMSTPGLEVRSGTVRSGKQNETGVVLAERKKIIVSKNHSASHIHRSVYRTPGVKLNKKGVKFVRNYLRKSNKRLYRIKKRSTIPFEIIDSVFDQYGLPTELRYLAVVESELMPAATSRVGAKGPWQLMPETAQILGLKVDDQVDERTDYYKSTPAAARYLKDLYAQFGDWLLVLAAYNGGPGPVYYAIRKSRSRNFWTMQHSLPAETRVHVKRFIATHYYFEGHGSVTTLTRKERIAYLKTVKRFERAHPGGQFAAVGGNHSRSTEKKVIPRSATEQQGVANRNSAGHDAVALAAPARNTTAETENEKFKRVMASAESAILNSTSSPSREKRK